MFGGAGGGRWGEFKFDCSQHVPVDKSILIVVIRMFVINRFSAARANTYILLSPSPVSSTYHSYMYVCAHARGHLLFISLDSMEVNGISRIGRAVAPSPIPLIQKTKNEKRHPENAPLSEGLQ